MSTDASSEQRHIGKQVTFLASEKYVEVSGCVFGGSTIVRSYRIFMKLIRFEDK